MKRALFRIAMDRVDPDRLVFLDESGANLAMGRSHAWVRKGQEFIEPRPMQWGENLTMIGAIRRRGWMTMSTMFTSSNGERFVNWVRARLLPKLSGARLVHLPPYSQDLNPIEPAWGLVKKGIRKEALRSAAALRRVARYAPRRVRRGHCESWFRHAGYGYRPN